MRALLYFLALCLALMAPVAHAQDKVKVPVQVEILNPGDLVSLSVKSEGDLGQIARSATTTCVYHYVNGTLTVSDLFSGESVPAPGATPAGCAQFGKASRPVLEVSCPGGMQLPIVIDSDTSLAYTSFVADQVLFNGVWITGSTVGDTVEYLLDCPTGKNTGVNSFPLELGVVGGISHQGAVPSGAYAVSIPVSVHYQ